MADATMPSSSSSWTGAFEGVTGAASASSAGDSGSSVVNEAFKAGESPMGSSVNSSLIFRLLASRVGSPAVCVEFNGYAVVNDVWRLAISSR